MRRERLVNSRGERIEVVRLTTRELPYVELIPQGTELGYLIGCDASKGELTNRWKMVTIFSPVKKSKHINNMFEFRCVDTKRQKERMDVLPEAQELKDAPTYPGYYYMNKNNIDRWYMFNYDYIKFINKIKSMKV
jgi:hypothetical protein